MADIISNMQRAGVAWFKMDEASGSLVDSKGSNAGVVTGTTVVAGYSGNARRFNGTASDYIRFANPIIPVGKKSIRLKIRASILPSNASYIFSTISNGTTHQGVTSFLYTDGKFYYQSFTGTALRYSIMSPSSLCDNQWHDILITDDGTTSANGVKLFVDNMTTPVAMVTSPSVETLQQFNLQLSGLSQTTTASQMFAGDIDEIEVYNDIISFIPNKILISLSDGSLCSAKIADKSLNVIPTMTSNTAPSGVASASSIYSTSYDAWNAFDKDANSTNNGWVSQNGALTGWLSYEFSQPKVIGKYEIMGSNATGGMLNNPKSWTFEGSNDGGNWTILDTQVSISSWTPTVFKSFVFFNINAYKKYRINVSSSNATSYIAIQELKMMETYVNYIYLNTAASESAFLSQGINKGDDLVLTSQMETKIFYTDSNTPIGVGKVFKRSIDTSKIPIKKVSIT